MNERAQSVAGGEEGVVLMLVLGFMTLVGVIVVALAQYTTTNLHATLTLRDVRGVQVSAASVVDGAINRVRFDPSVANSASCFTSSINGLQLHVDCTGPLTGAVTTVALVATLDTANPVRTVLSAHAEFDRTDPFNVTVRVVDWSVKK